MSNRAKKTHPRQNQKPSRQEVSQAFQQVGNDLQELRVALAWSIDLLMAKGLFTAEELKAFFEAKKVQAQEAMKAALNPPKHVPTVTDPTGTAAEDVAAENIAAIREELVAGS